MYQLNNTLLLLLFGSGLLFGPFGPYVLGLSVNKLLLVMTLLMSTLIFLSNVSFSRRFVIVLIAWLMFLIWFGLIVPSTNGTILKYAVSELRSFAWVFVVIPVLHCMKSGGWPLLVSRLSIPVFIVALTIDVIYILATIGYPEAGFALRVILGLFADTAGSATDNIFIGPIHDGSFRVMWVFSIVLPFFIIWGIDNLSGISRLLFMSVLLVALIASGSRILLFVTGLLLVSRVQNTRQLISCGLFGFCSLLLLIYAKPGFAELRIFSIAQDFASGSARGGQITALLSEFSKKPFLGHGLGFYSVDFIRNEAAPYSYEFVYLSLLTKIGMVGFMFTSVLLLMLISSLGITKEKIFLLISFLIITATNPFLWTLLGTFCFSFAILYKQHNSRGLHA